MNRIANISMIIEHRTDEVIKKLNDLLHEHQDIILGRMGIPLKAQNVNVISIALFADEDMINAFNGKLGKIDGIQTKTLYSKDSY